MRNLLHTRKQFVRAGTRHVQRLQKTLEAANIKRRDRSGGWRQRRTLSRTDQTACH